MGATYTRQSSYTDGDTISAAHTNDEYNQLVAAFAASSGHTHDGTTGEGGPITKLLGTSITIGDGTAGTDITVTFDGETGDGVLKWMEDEDYFEFSDDILIATNEKIQFRDTGIYINSSADGQLDLVADTEIQIAATTIDINGNVDISGTLTIGGAGISEAELEILDGATVTTTEINIMDGDTSASATTVVDADRVVFNDDGTMKQVAVTDLAAYFDDEITAMPNLVSTGALNSGSITSGFTSIDVGSGAISTTGTVTFGSLADGTITVTAFVDEDNMASDSATLIPTQQSVKAYVDSNIGDVVTSFVLEDDDGTEVTIGNGKEIKFVGSGLTTNWTDVSTGSDADPYDITFTVDAAQTGITSVKNTSLAIGRDDDNLIKFSTDNQIIFEVSGGDNVIFKASGEIEATSLDISGDVDVDGTLEADAITLDGTAVTTTATLSTGISNGNLAVFTSGAADNDFLRIDGTSIEGRSASEVLSDIGGQASLTFGISNTNAVKIDSASVADDEYARFTANGLESRSTSEVLSDIGAVTAADASNDATALAIALG